MDEVTGTADDSEISEIEVFVTAKVSLTANNVEASKIAEVSVTAKD